MSEEAVERVAGLLRGGSGENGTCIWDIMGCELGIEIQLQVQEKRDVWGIGRPARAGVTTNNPRGFIVT